MKRIIPFLERLPVVAQLIEMTRHIKIPGFQGLPLYDVALFFFRGLNKGDIQMRARSASFSFFLALFPAVIFLFTLIPYIPIDGFQDRLLVLIQALLPANTYQASYQTIEDIIRHQRGGLLSFGFVFALYVSTNGVFALLKGFSQTYHARESRSPFRLRIASLVLTLVFAFLIFMVIAMIIGSEIAAKYIIQKKIMGTRLPLFLLNTGRWLILAGLCFTAISLLYSYGMSRPSRSIRWKFVTAGSTLATILVIATSLGFNYFITHFGQFNKIYGSIGTLIVILSWIFFNVLQLIIGFELNASIDMAKRNPRIRKIGSIF